jgi:hypothetical protein
MQNSGPPFNSPYTFSIGDVHGSDPALARLIRNLPRRAVEELEHFFTSTNALRYLSGLSGLGLRETACRAPGGS